MSSLPLRALGSWQEGTSAPAFAADALVAAVQRVRETAHVVRDGGEGRVGMGFGGDVRTDATGSFPLLATLPPLYPEWLGERSFLEAHHLRFPYVAGPMANGIATTRLVIAMGEAGMLGFFGAAGLSPERVEAALVEIETALGPKKLPWGSNLIHSPNESDLEDAVADLYIRRGVRRIDASAFMGLTPAIVRYACHGLTADANGAVRRKNLVLAKVSRPEVARRFLSPAPREVLDTLVAQKKLTGEEARLAERVPLAEDLTVEADSGGHTDNRPLVALFPTIRALADQMTATHGYRRPVRVGAAGGLGTPASVAAAFALGAAYVLTGSVNQGAVESGLSEDGRRMLALADVADVVMAPAADMFELGVKVQVLRRGTLFAQRALRLYEVYQEYAGIEAIPPEVKKRLEADVFRQTMEQVWAETERFFQVRDPRENERAARDPRHRLALVCRWYLGKSSRWAIAGGDDRRTDFQIWCGPAMGAFNAWVKGSPLEAPEKREAVQIARNLLEGAAVLTRAHQLRTYGAAIPARAFDFRPRRLG